MQQPNVNDLNDAVRLAMQKCERYILAKMGKDPDRALLEWQNMEIAWDNYHCLCDMVQPEVIDAHRAALPDLVVRPVAA